jgi:predicted GH43/DUF377 family glycosyl hydrolase
MFVVRRLKNNPILEPNSGEPWQAYAAFNPSPIRIGKKTNLLYRAISEPRPIAGGGRFFMSTIGKAEDSGDATTEQLIAPEESWERYGCEDPRVTHLDGRYYIFYTALSHFPFSADGIRVAVAISKDLKTIQEKHLVTPFNAKAMTLFPEKINGKFMVIMTAHTDSPPSKVAIAQFDREEDMWSADAWNAWHDHIDEHSLSIKRNQDERVEIGSTPLKTRWGWLLFYSHIQHYYSSDRKIFGIEAILLDIKDPKKILGRTRNPLLVPEETYERYGTVPGVIFPSGALLVTTKKANDTVRIYYGGADTVCAAAEVNLEDLITTMMGGNVLTRFSRNPILAPTENLWEKKAVFNPAAIDIDTTVHLLYRAMSPDNTSVIGYAASKNGTDISARSNVPAYQPREPFEMKGVVNGNSGCEDPRLSKIDDRIFMTYTAFNGKEAAAVAVTSTTEKEFKIGAATGKWQWQKPVLVSPPGIDDKDACIIQTSHKGALLFHRVNNAICVSPIDPLNPTRINDYNVILEPRQGMWDGQKIGINAPPIPLFGAKTAKSPAYWLLLYHGVSGDFKYRLGVALLDGADPTKVLARSTDWILEPEMKYEKEGQVGNVVFPCGAVIRGDTLFVYYGGADTTVNVAIGSIDTIVGALLRSK